MKIFFFALLILLLPASGFSNSLLDFKNIGDAHAGYEWFIDQAGIICIDKRGFANASYCADLKQGAAQYDIELAVKDVPDENGESSDIKSDVTGDVSGGVSTASPYICIRVETCTACNLIFHVYVDR